jgi:N-acetyl-gamma-glutamylphosphate reductase
VTGYVAGDTLYALNEKHPDYEYSVLVRTQEKADIVKKAFPNVRIVLGGNDDSDVLKEEAGKADIVLRELKIRIYAFKKLLLILV